MVSTPESIDLDPSLKIIGKNDQRKLYKKFRVVVNAKDKDKVKISPQLDPNVKIINEFGKDQLKKEGISKKERKEIEKELGKKIKKKLKISKNPCWIRYY